MQNLFLLFLALVLAVTIWCYWRISRKAGRRGWWAFLLLSPAVGFFMPAETHPWFFQVVPLIVPAALIWLFAYVRWPTFEPAPDLGDNRYMPPPRTRDRPARAPAQPVKAEPASREPRADTPQARSSVPQIGASGEGEGKSGKA
jgi:hypothetical protein